jgi:hypothetical protein
LAETVFGVGAGLAATRGLTGFALAFARRFGAFLGFEAAWAATAAAILLSLTGGFGVPASTARAIFCGLTLVAASAEVFSVAAAVFGSESFAIIPGSYVAMHKIGSAGAKSSKMVQCTKTRECGYRAFT